MKLRRRVSSSRDPRCNGVIGYELTGLRSPSWRGSRRRKLVEGNRFITRDRQEAGEEGGGQCTRRREKTARGFARALHERLRRSRCAFLLLLALSLCVSLRIYIHQRALCYSVPFVSSPSLFRSPRVSAVFLLRREQHVDERRNRNTTEPLGIPSTSAYRGKPYRTPHLSLFVCLFAQKSHALSGSPLIPSIR